MGQILQFAGTFVPEGFLPCDGRQLNISEFETLFTLVGTTYGGDGQSTFNLPNLVGCVMVGAGAGSFGTIYTLGQTGGAATVTLNGNQNPAHSHTLMVVNSGGSGTGQPGSNTFVASQSSQSSANSAYLDTPPTVTMGASTSPAGGSQPHNNMQPVLAVTYGIAVDGMYPTQS